MKNIFNELEQENITYAVCVSLIKSTFDSCISQREYYIIANKKDVARRYGFTTRSDSDTGVYTRGICLTVRGLNFLRLWIDTLRF